MNPPSNSYALPQSFMASRLIQKPKLPPTTNIQPKIEEPIEKIDDLSEENNLNLMPETDIKENLLPEENDKSALENNEFQELLDIIYDVKQINIVYGKDRRTQITPAVLTGKKDVIYEHEIPSMIRKSSEEGYKDMLDLNYKQAMINFKKSENIINVIYFFKSL